MGIRPVLLLALVPNSTVGRERADGDVAVVPKLEEPLWLEKLSLKLLSKLDEVVVVLDVENAGVSVGTGVAAEVLGRKRKLNMVGILFYLRAGKLSPDDRFGCFFI